MKILFPADGSDFTKKALAFLVTHETLCGPDDELLVINVQPPMAPRVKSIVGASVVKDYHREEAERVLDPIDKFLKRHKITYRTQWLVGAAAAEIIQVAQREQVHLIVMGTHGHGFFGTVVMGSVAQRVVAQSEVPVLLVK